MIVEPGGQELNSLTDEQIVKKSLEPLYTPNGAAIGMYPRGLESEQEGPKPGFTETLSAEFSNNNPMVAGFRFIKNQFLDYNPDDSLNYQRDSYVEGYKGLNENSIVGIPQEYWPQLIETDNHPDETEKVREDIFRRMKNQEIIDTASWGDRLAGEFIARSASLSMAIPIMGQIKYATVGAGVLRNAMTALPGVAASSIVDNALLLAGDKSKTFDEAVKDTMIETGIGTAFFGLWGGAKALGSYGTAKAMTHRIRGMNEAQFAGLEVKVEADEAGQFKRYVVQNGQDSVGAQRVQIDKAQRYLDEGIVGMGDNWAFKKIFSISPIVRMLSSPFVTVREAGNGLFRHNIVTGNKAKGIAFNPAEDTVINFRTLTDNLELMTNQAWAESTGLKGPLKGVQAKLSAAEYQTNMQFRADVARAIRDGGKHATNPAAAKVAQAYRAELYDHTAELSVKAGIFDSIPDVRTAEGYLMRVWNKDAMTGNGKYAYLATASGYLRRQNEQLKALHAPFENIKTKKASATKEQIAKLEAEEAKLLEDLKARIETGEIDAKLLKKNDKGEKVLHRVIDDEEIELVAQSTYDNIMQESDDILADRIFGMLKGKGGTNPTKERAWLIPDNEVEQFLVNDAVLVANKYAAGMSRRIAFANFLKSKQIDPKSGGKEEIINALRAEKAEMEKTILETVAPSKQDKALHQLQKEFNDAVNLLSDSVEVFMGTFKNSNTLSARVLRAQRNFTMSTMLGRVALTQFADLGFASMKTGIWDYFGNGVAPVLRNMAKLRLRNPALKHEFNEMAAGMEMVTNTHMDEIWGSGGTYQPQTWWESGSKNIAKTASNLFLMSPWMDFIKNAAAYASQARSARILMKWAKTGKMSQFDIERFADMGLDIEKYGKIIVEELNKPGGSELIDGVVMPRWVNWENLEAAQAFKQATANSIRSSAVNPNMMSVPLFIQKNPVWASVFQFTSFAFSATEQIVVPLLTRPERNKLMGAMAAMAFASLTDPLRQISRGEEPDLDTTNLFTKAVLNSGLGGAHLEFALKLNSAMDIRALRPYQIDRFRKKTFPELFAGPAGGQLQSMNQVLTMVLNNEINQTDAMRLLGLIPFSGAFYVNRPLKNFVQSLNIPETRQQAKALHGE